jgi:DNA polymerase III delta prime subunit
VKGFCEAEGLRLGMIQDWKGKGNGSSNANSSDTNGSDTVMKDVSDSGGKNGSNADGTNGDANNSSNTADADEGPVISLETKKMVILDEADNMTKDAQFALRRIIEDYSENARFVVICSLMFRKLRDMIIDSDSEF